MDTDWLTWPYQARGRNAGGVDCWGLARMMRYALRGDWLPTYDAVEPADGAAMNAAAAQVLEGWSSGPPALGALATVWRGGWCRHIGVVIETEQRLAVAETNRKSGTRWLWIADFERRYGRDNIVYYDHP